MDFPTCPACQTGHLVPFSMLSTTYAFWACTRQDCSYTLSGMTTSIKVFKGVASRRDVAKAEKSWSEHEF